LIKNGKRTKEIGELLHMSSGAINFHRNNIRKKLGLNNEKMNLRSYLMSL
ncbi:MAG: helix-turn-helix transcriptional regulator, partial [Syntrophus sp. (in: bacteria)]|nr:helix-turn-helix transcriptional regulator [Syntrophus sp. (in: bacteria)]